MAPLMRLLQSLGNAGAVANAHRACEERRLTEARIEAVAQRLAPPPGSSAGPRVGVAAA